MENAANELDIVRHLKTVC